MHLLLRVDVLDAESAILKEQPCASKTRPLAIFEMQANPDSEHARALGGRTMV